MTLLSYLVGRTRTQTPRVLVGKTFYSQEDIGPIGLKENGCFGVTVYHPDLKVEKVNYSYYSGYKLYREENIIEVCSDAKRSYADIEKYIKGSMAS